MKADTIEEAAKFFDIDVNNLKETIAKVNEYAKTKDDKDFHHRGGLVSLEEGPIILKKSRSFCSPYNGWGCYQRTEVLNEKGEPIPGLYAAGELTGLSREEPSWRKCDYGYYHIRTYCR